MAVNVVLESLSSGGNIESNRRTDSDSGISYIKISSNSDDMLESGDIGLDHLFPDGIFMVQGVFLDIDGLITNDSNNWEINLGV